MAKLYHQVIIRVLTDFDDNNFQYNASHDYKYNQLVEKNQSDSLNRYRIVGQTTDIAFLRLNFKMNVIKTPKLKYH